MISISSDAPMKETDIAKFLNDAMAEVGMPAMFLNVWQDSRNPMIVVSFVTRSMKFDYFE